MRQANLVSFSLIFLKFLKSISITVKKQLIRLVVLTTQRKQGHKFVCEFLGTGSLFKAIQGYTQLYRTILTYTDLN